MYWDGLPYQIPVPPQGEGWKVAINTSMAGPDDIFDMSEGPAVDQQEVIVGPRSIMVLVSAPRA
jgi:hypothetical protein